MTQFFPRSNLSKVCAFTSHHISRAVEKKINTGMESASSCQSQHGIHFLNTLATPTTSQFYLSHIKDIPIVAILASRRHLGRCGFGPRVTCNAFFGALVASVGWTRVMG
eukprot:scaffold1954_cov153-Amphora_coffeaeformis.AAC.3